MGYTHYWTGKEIPRENWDCITKCAQHLFKHLPCEIQREFNDPSAPVVNEDEIRFNGVEDDGHETFQLSRNLDGFNFCKTASKDYDLAVVAVLLIANHYAGEYIKISSDGNPADWQEGLSLVQELFNFGRLPKEVING